VERVLPGADRSQLHAYEFGAGWDLIGPIATWALGVDRQTLVDIRPNARLELVNDTISRFARDPVRLERALGQPLRPVANGEPLTNIGELANRFGISYLAPHDARAVGLADETVDLVTSTFTLEHIPPADIAGILAETRRILAPNGLVSCLIDMHDHYIYSDPGISAYNFLRFPGWLWRLFNPRLAWQSRLRHSQYLELFTREGFEIVSDEPQLPDGKELNELGAMRLAPEFRGLSLVDLGTKATHLIARRAAADYS
jgi:SAM-dependent methyltransferase